MADVTISSLPLGTPSGSGLIPFSQGGQTYSTALAQLSSLPFIPKAFVAFNGYDNFTVVGGETRCQIWNSYNIQKVVKVNTGQYNVFFITPMPNTPYCVSGSMGDVQNVGNERISINASAMYPSYFMVYSYLNNDNLGDNAYIGLIIFSN